MIYETYQTLVYAWMSLAAIIFVILLNIAAPYGRHISPKWGPLMNNKFGWFLMEVPGIVLLLYFVIANSTNQNAMTWILVALFIFHYVNRTFVYPVRIRTKGKKMPVIIAGSGIFFNMVNGFLLGYYFGHFGEHVSDDFLKPHFISGIALFALGIYINWDYDNRLIHLRKPGETSYKIPEGGLFSYISCPNLLGEIIEWAGYAIMCWNLAAVSFLVWTVANLIPRALSHHKWYRQQFDNYPVRRKAVFPFIL